MYYFPQVFIDILENHDLTALCYFIEWTVMSKPMPYFSEFKICSYIKSEDLHTS